MQYCQWIWLLQLLIVLHLANLPKVLMTSDATPSSKLEKSAKHSPLSDLLNSDQSRKVQKLKF